MAISEKMRTLVLQKARGKLPLQVKWRRHFHQAPEISNQEFRTTAYIERQVKNLGLKVTPIKLDTGLVAELHGGHRGKTAAVRTDIDALPVREMTRLSFKSRIDGAMHACGHDVHMAVVLGVAAILGELRADLKGKVRFIFQPAEEEPPGGAEPLIAGGVLKDVKMIFGLHVDPHLSTGKISLRDGVTMGSVTDFDLIVHGRGGHAARPNDGVDAIATAADVVNSVQKVVAREVDPIEPLVITFGKIEGGTARNTICDRVKLTGTARTLSPALARRLPGLIKKAARGACQARRARLEMNLVASYPVLSNHPEANRILATNYEALFGKGKIERTELVLGGEDFARYLQKTKGAMFRLGVMNRKIGADKPWHSPAFTVDEKAILYGTALIAASVIDFLHGGVS
ncbi:MAG: amidohydrolase [Candidatus Zixiibacteriota bacterium]|nr:MAG: amidohydrolase [candidate division Zixibacteria bacterium]